MNKLSLYDHQHYIDRGWGGVADGEPIDCTNFHELVVTVRWKTAGGLGIAAVRALGTNLDQDAHQLGAVLPPCAASEGCALSDGGAHQQNMPGGLVVAVWRNLPKWVVVRVECLNGTDGEGSALRVAVLGR
jgi:hypothetical protein